MLIHYKSPVLKRIFAFALLILFLFNTIGYYFIFEIYKYRVKKEIQNAIHPGSVSVTILKIVDIQQDPQFQRVEKKEFRYKGALYDVIKEVRSGRTTIFYCIHDKKEEDLLATMNTVNKNKFLLSLWQHLIKIAYLSDNLAFKQPFPVEILFPTFSVPLTSVLIKTFSPPPESA